MTYETILDNEWGTVRYYKEDNYVFHALKKGAPAQHLRPILDAGVETLSKNNSSKWLSDDRLNDVLDIDWDPVEWGEMVAALGWRYWALVVPDSVVGRASMVDVITLYYEMGILIRVFSDLERARAWLIAQK